MERTGRRALEHDSQHSAGRQQAAPAGMLGLSNQAFAALVARDATKEKPKEKAPVTGPRVVFPDIGAVPIESMQWAGGGRPPGGGQDRPSEVTFTSKVGDHSSDLMRQALEGKAQDVEVFLSGTKFKLKGAMVSSYSTGAGGENEPLESWTLNFQAIEFEGQKDGDAEPPGGERYPG
jgi:hypothetical protein